MPLPHEPVPHDDDSAVDWRLLQHDSQRRSWDWFADLSKTVRDEPAFAFPAFDPSIENHTDTSFGWRILSMRYGWAPMPARGTD